MQGNRGVFTKILAAAGTFLAWLPILAPVLLGFALLFSRGMYRIDYLMPAEVFPVAVAGGLLLLWAAIRARSQRKLIGWGLVVAVAMWFGFQLLALALGLASGAYEPAGWRFAVVLAGLGVYILALAATGVGGILLLREVFRAREKEVKMVPKIQEISITRSIHAKPERVYISFTTEEGWCDWCAEKAEADPRPGGKLHIYTEGYHAYGEFTDLVPGRAVSFTWNGDKEPPTIVNIELHPSDDATILTFKVTGLCSEQDWANFAPQVERIWARVLDNLKNGLESKPEI